MGFVVPAGVGGMVCFAFGALYLPFEILKVAEHRGWETIAVLVINLVIVFYMLEIRIREARSRENGVTSNSP